MELFGSGCEAAVMGGVQWWWSSLPRVFYFVAWIVRDPSSLLLQVLVLSLVRAACCLCSTTWPCCSLTVCSQFCVALWAGVLFAMFSTMRDTLCCCVFFT
jgi:hypothetical protein